MQIVGIVAAVLVAMGSKTDYGTGFLDLVVYLLQQGCVDPVLGMISNWASSGSADPLLVRHFIFKTLAVCGPPYSAYFTSMLLRWAVTFLKFVWLFAYVAGLASSGLPP